MNPFKEVAIMKINTLLSVLEPVLNQTLLNRLTVITEALLSMQGKITMLGMSRWATKGGSYRTIQRFFHSVIPWCSLMWVLIQHHLIDCNEVILIAGDETTVTKSGKKTHGLGRFFSSIYNRFIPGLGFFSISLISVKHQKAYPILMKQLDPAMSRRVTPEKPKRKKKLPLGRPKGSKNKNRRDVEMTPYLLFLQEQIKEVQQLIGQDITPRYFLYDGAFGNNPCLQITRSCGLELISKINCNSRLYFPFDGEYSGKGKPRKYGDKIDYSRIPNRYLVESTIEDNIKTNIYQATMWHKDYPDQLNVTIIQKENLSKRKEGRVILFCSDLDLDAKTMIHYYRLRFQIEFTFREAKQHWGLEDFMTIKEQSVQNAANLSMFMVNVSQALGRTASKETPFSVNDLKARFHGIFYVKELLST
jgi:putative transposase